MSPYTYIEGNYVFFVNQFMTQMLYYSHHCVPIIHICSSSGRKLMILVGLNRFANNRLSRSEEHTSELQSRFDIVCRLLLVKINLSYSLLGYRSLRNYEI